MPSLSMPSFSQLRAFVTLCDHKHYGDAAAALGVSQPSLSQSISALEKRVDGPLIERTTRQVLITPLGQDLLPFARDAVLAAEGFIEAASRISQERYGQVRLGIIPTAAPYLAESVASGVPNAANTADFGRISEFREMTTPDILDALACGDIDLGLVALDESMERFISEPLWDEDLVIAVPDTHPWVGRTNVKPAELSRQPLILMEAGNCLRDQTLALCNIPINEVAATTIDMATALRLVKVGGGLAVVPEGALRTGEGQTVSVGRFAEPVPTRRLALIHRPSTVHQESFEEIAERLRDYVDKTRMVVTPIE